MFYIIHFVVCFLNGHFPFLMVIDILHSPSGDFSLNLSITQNNKIYTKEKFTKSLTLYFHHSVGEED